MKRIRLPRIRTLTPQQGRALLDRRAQAELGMTGEQFARKWKAGDFRYRAGRPEVLRVAMLLPFAR